MKNLLSLLLLISITSLACDGNKQCPCECETEEVLKKLEAEAISETQLPN